MASLAKINLKSELVASHTTHLVKQDFGNLCKKSNQARSKVKQILESLNLCCNVIANRQIQILIQDDSFQSFNIVYIVYFRDKNDDNYSLLVLLKKLLASHKILEIILKYKEIEANFLIYSLIYISQF